MTFNSRRQLLSACVIALSILGAGYFVGKGTSNFKSGTRTVTVKGLADRDVTADFVFWTLNLRRADANIAAVQGSIKKDRDQLIQFLISQGLAEADMERVPISTQDKQANQFSVVPQQRDQSTRYVASATVVVRTAKVDVVRSAVGAMDQLLQAGVLLSASREEGKPSLVYRYTKFNELRPALIADATKNARSSAEKFATDSDKRVGPIRSAQQGLIQIFGEEGQDEAGGYVTTSFRKRIRIVNTIEFDLVD